MNDLISRHKAIDIVRNIIVKEVTTAYMLVDKAEVMTELMMMPPAQPEITDEQAIEHLRESGWMQNHDKQMHEMGLREQLADDSDSYDALLPSAQPERQKGKWIDHTEDGYVECPFCHSATNCDGNKDELHFCFSCGADMRGEQNDEQGSN